MINKQGPGKIDWTDWTWNPISGCLHGCPYCYMNRMEKRFKGIMEPKFHPERLEEMRRSKKVKPGDKVFVGSSGDMWGDWVNHGWIMKVLEVAILKPSVIFQFLTKNPDAYHGWAVSENMWFGTTVDGADRTMGNIGKLIGALSSANCTVKKFCSFEPLLDFPVVETPFIEKLDWIIIGADSTRGAKRPPQKWADWLIEIAREYNIPVWVKDNYGYPEVIKEFPNAKG